MHGFRVNSTSRYLRNPYDLGGGVGVVDLRNLVKLALLLIKLHNLDLQLRGTRGERRMEGETEEREMEKTSTAHTTRIMARGPTLLSSLTFTTTRRHWGIEREG